MDSRKPHPLILVTLAIILLTITFVASHAQSAPPVKMGLWEATIHHTMTGLTLPPEVIARLKAAGRPMPGDDSTTVTQSCLTPAEWKKGFEDARQNSDCTRTNMVENSHQLSFDMTCKTPNRPGSTTGHMEMFFDNPEHTHGTMHMTSTQMNQQGSTVNMTMKIEGHFISSNCGDIKPGEPKILRDK